MFDAVLVLGKELRGDPVRAVAELRARSAAAAVALRQGAQAIATLEAPLRGQAASGSALVAENLHRLAVPAERIVQREETHSTREEALRGHLLATQRGWRRLLVVTSAYHVPRARHIFVEHFGEARVSVHAPEGFLRDATPFERAWITAATPSAETLRQEDRLEQRLLHLTRALSILPATLAWRLEIAAGQALRRVSHVE